MLGAIVQSRRAEGSHLPTQLAVWRRAFRSCARREQVNIKVAKINTMKHIKLLVLAAIAALAIEPTTVWGGALSDRREAVISESSQPRVVGGTERFAVALPYEKTFEAVVTALKTSDNEVSDANKDAGLIATAIAVTGGWRQTGTRTVVSVIRDTDGSSIVKVVVTEQKRFKALQTEPWSDPKANPVKTSTAAAALKQALGGK